MHRTLTRVRFTSGYAGNGYAVVEDGRLFIYDATGTSLHIREDYPWAMDILERVGEFETDEELRRLFAAQPSPPDLFNIIVRSELVHHAFARLKASSGHVGARQLMNQIFGCMRDPNGNFLRDFQSDGFYSRLFEIACFQYLSAQGFAIDQSFPSPDFLIERDGLKVAIEAVTTSPTAGQHEDISVMKLPRLSKEEVFAKSRDEVPIRIGRSLIGKVQKKYWEMPHCAGMPLVLFVAPLHEPGSVNFVDGSLARYLYGVETFPAWIERNGILVLSAPVTHHHHGDRWLPSNFFGQPGCDNISAVAYSNSFTIPKFVRTAIELGMERDVVAVREGTCLLPESPNDFAEFEYQVGSESAPLETWWQGVTVFHNPRARNPLPRGFLEATSEFHYDGSPQRQVHDFHPVVSFTNGLLNARGK